ncbi:MAG: type IX secretion system membrane protein PorP/SprF [Flavobacteriales bacterium]|nr:type IX secretion system membrane protein PorP/SprF [Flavobacteriales bacterium]
MRKLYSTLMNLRAIVVAGLTFTALLGKVHAQQDPQFTQFYFNKLMINPATAGYHDNICVNLFNRFQWTGFEKAPFTNQLSVDANLKTFIKHDIGVGLTVFNDNIGFFNTTGLRLAGAYRFQLGPGRLGVGLDLGFQNMIVNGASWNPPQTSIDASLPITGNSMVFDAGLGVFYHTPLWYAGISAKQLPGMRFKDFSYRAARHMFFTGGYTFKAVGGNPNIDINPNAIVKTDLATVSFDVNVNMIYKEKYWGGLTYRFQDAVALNLGMVLYQTPKHSFIAGYSYDLTTSRLLRFSYGTHELFLRYCFKMELPPMGGGFRVRDLDSKRDW